MRRSFILAVFCFLVSLCDLKAQSPFFDFYDFYPGASQCTIVKMLPDSSGYVVFGSWIPSIFTVYPMVFTTDLEGHELKHFIDTTANYDILTYGDGVVDENKNYYIAGQGQYAALAKYDSNGSRLFQKYYTLGSITGESGFTKMLIYRDTLYLTGGITSLTDTISSGFLCKIDVNGNVIDSFFYRPPYGGTSGCIFSNLVLLNDSTIILFGNSEHPGLATPKPFIQKVSLYGDTLGSYTILEPGDSVQESGYYLDRLSDRKFVVGGYLITDVSNEASFYQVFNSSLTPVTAYLVDSSIKEYGVKSLAAADSNHFYSVGEFNPGNQISIFCNLFNYADTEITIVWQRRLTTDHDICGNSIAVINNKALITGFTTSTVCPSCALLMLLDDTSCFDLDCASLPLGVSISEIITGFYHLEVYPNPFWSALNIQYDDYSVGYKFQLKLYDLSGRLLFENNYEGRSNIELDLSGLLPGCYILEGTNADKRWINKVIKQD